MVASNAYKSFPGFYSRILGKSRSKYSFSRNTVFSVLRILCLNVLFYCCTFSARINTFFYFR